MKEATTCIKKVDFVLVGTKFTVRTGGARYDNWNAFVKRADKILERDFQCTDEDFGRLCVRNSVASG